MMALLMGGNKVEGVKFGVERKKASFKMDFLRQYE